MNSKIKIKGCLVLLSVVTNVYFINAQNKVKLFSYNLSLSKEKCESWKYPSKEIVKKIFSTLTPLEGSTHHCCYNSYSCIIDGLVLYKNKKYKYSLNAGGWVSLVSLDYKEQFLLACTDSRFFKYFLSVYDVSGYFLSGNFFNK